MLRGLSRVNELQNELAHARTIINDLTSENRILKVTERRQQNALSKYEGIHAELPLVIRSCGEELMSIQTRLRRSKVAFRQLETKYRLQTKDLLALQNKYKHLLDLTKNKQLGEREKLSTQLEEAENKMKQQEKKIQFLVRKIEVEKKSHQHQLNAENAKTKALQAELSAAKEANDRLESMAEKLKYQGFVGRKCYVSRGTVDASGPKVRSKNTVAGGDRAPSLDGRSGKLTRPALVHGESELSDHTKDLQKSLMVQVHQDVINKPNILAAKKKKSSDSSSATSRLSYGISELIKDKDLSDEWSDGSGAQDADGPVVVTNPFSLIDKYGQTGTGVKPESANSIYYRGRTNAKKTAKRDRGPVEDSDGDSDEGDDDVASSKTFSETD